MKSTHFLRELLEKQLIDAHQYQQIETHERTRPMSLHWELRALLYAGIVLFTSGAGILIYQNIDTIGHSVLIGALTLLTIFGFWYVLKHAAPFATTETAPAKLTDFVLLLSCLLFLALEGYLQYQYGLFGTRYGLASAIPAALFMALAYRFDHRGVLSMGITALASWVGLSVAPLEILKNDFGNQPLLYTAVLFSAAAISVALWLDFKVIKQHFTYTYLLLLGNLFFVAALAGLFSIEARWWFFAPLIGVGCWVCVRYAHHYQSFLFLLMAVVYGYIGLSYLFFKIYDWSSDSMILLAYLYFFATAGGVVWFFLNYKKLLGIKK
ncbi:MAG: DUF2157 domain-containing protein [Runella slithyformis]|nr:MAG: DUF2157 domain-containing protein [Runella slithyformis]TAF28843.1 MAG: DUF2157 domain-containing protein [Runella slithyformis]TAF48960.1 MAG: DUF2157 domain-containing protein [Runella slithyformis]TAF83520.1 MAG: DUF2157 domain-containing protein [Runella slithyformis]